MLKVYDYAVTFSEFPNEIALCLNISNCPCHCEGCSESYLQKDIGEDATWGKKDSFIDSLMTKYKDYGLTLLGFMGGDAEHNTLKHIAEYVKKTYNLKIGVYSGFDYIDLDLLSCVDYYKYGRFILPKGDVNSWWKKSCGTLNFPFSNQRMLKKVDNKLIDITEEFRKVPLSDLDRYIVKGS